LEKVNELLTYAINVRLAHSSVCTIYDNADRIKQSAMLGTEVSV